MKGGRSLVLLERQNKLTKKARVDCVVVLVIDPFSILFLFSLKILTL